MVHHRLNEKETNPNSHINFITALPSYDPTEQEAARQLLRALAAQVRPVMKSHGFTVNSFEEYEHNQVFLGRNWNNGETVELVLRGASGIFYPTSMLMSTLCHEALWSRLRAEVRQLQDRGYYGDGYWSSGTRLADSARIGGDGIEASDIPEYMCGGAHSRARPTSVRRRRGPTGKRREVVPSLHTGRQTARKKKAGSRVTSKYAFTGEGNTLADETDGVKGKGKGKQAASKRAREERALAVEKRLQALQAQSQESKPSTSKMSSEEAEEYSDDEVEIVSETNEERRERLLSSTQGENLNSLKFGSWRDFDDDFNFSVKPQQELGDACQVSVASGASGTDGPAVASEADREDKISEVSRARKVVAPPLPSLSTGKKGLISLAKSEIDLRKKEMLGMAPVKGGGRTLGGPSQTSRGSPASASVITKSQPSRSLEEGWDCLVCTLKNEPGHLACSACSTPRGESEYTVTC